MFRFIAVSVLFWGTYPLGEKQTKQSDLFPLLSPAKRHELQNHTPKDLSPNSDLKQWEQGQRTSLLPVARDSTQSRTSGSQEAAEESRASLARAPELKEQAEGQSSPYSHSAQADE